jgi:hypothetical protein
MANIDVNSNIGRSNEYSKFLESLENNYNTNNNRNTIDINSMVERCNKRIKRRISYRNGTKRNIDRISTILDNRSNVVCKFFLGIFSCKSSTCSRLGVNMATSRNNSSKYMGNTIVGKLCTIGIRIYIDIGTSCNNRRKKRLGIDITSIYNNTRSTICILAI